MPAAPPDAAADLRRAPLDFLSGLAPVARERGVVRFRVGRQPVVLIGDPALAREVLTTRARMFVKQNVLSTSGAGYDARDPADDPARHAAGRRRVAPAFSADRQTAHAEIALRRAESMCADWRDGLLVDVSAAARRLSVATVAEAVFGTDLDPDEADALARAADKVFAPFELVSSPVRSALGTLRVRRTRSQLTGKRRLDRFVAGAIDARTEPPDLPALLAGADDAPRRALGVFLAGIETTAVALEWVWVLLARDADAERRVHLELDEHARRPLDLIELGRLRLVHGAVAEALRLYPPSWFIARRAIEPLQVGNESLEAGDVALISPYLQHRDPRLFPNPERFDPGRWDAAAEPVGLIAFGLGPRRCLGERLARLVAAAAIATVGRGFQLTLPADSRVVPAAVSSLRVRGGLRLRARARAASERPAAT